ncbi:MAG: hypothetical protein R3E77_16360 [Steroidobacteraceae bacterium]
MLRASGQLDNMRHQDLSAKFRIAIPPRPVPAAKRVMWWLVLRLARWRLGMALLRRWLG